VVVVSFVFEFHLPPPPPFFVQFFFFFFFFFYTGFFSPPSPSYPKPPKSPPNTPPLPPNKQLSKQPKPQRPHAAAPQDTPRHLPPAHPRKPTAPSPAFLPPFLCGVFFFFFPPPPQGPPLVANPPFLLCVWWLFPFFILVCPLKIPPRTPRFHIFLTGGCLRMIFYETTPSLTKISMFLCPPPPFFGLSPFSGRGVCFGAVGVLDLFFSPPKSTPVRGLPVPPPPCAPLMES